MSAPFDPRTYTLPDRKGAPQRKDAAEPVTVGSPEWHRAMQIEIASLLVFLFITGLVIIGALFAIAGPRA